MDKRRIADRIYTFVCDDVRHELGNKVSIMGIYDDLFVRELPVILPKVNFVIQFKKIKHDIKSVKVVLKTPSGEIVELPEIKLVPNKKMGSSQNMDMCVAPFKIDKPGKLVWEVTIDGEKKPSIIHEMNVDILAPIKAQQQK